MDTHPERFRPLHSIADALISHVIDSYDVTVLADPGVVQDLLHEYVMLCVPFESLLPDVANGWAAWPRRGQSS